MKYCLLCTQPFQTMVTWQTLLLKSFPKVICSRCEQKFEPVSNNDETNISLFTYNEAMKSYLHQYKFLQDIALAHVFAEKLAQHLSKLQATIVPIPMHPEKKCQRTFAHVDELLNAAQLSYIQLLEKTTTDSQSAKTFHERINVAPLFRLKEAADVQSIRYILVDDIRTTGTTLNHAKKVLLENGAKEVWTLTLIRG